MVRMPHLPAARRPAPNLHWDYKDQLQRIDLGGGGTVYYVYDASGQRVRKVWEKAPGHDRGAHLPRRLRGLPAAQRRGRGDARARDAARHGRQAAHRAGRDAHVERQATIRAGQADPLPARQPPRLGSAGAGRAGADHLLRGVHARTAARTYQAVRSQTETPKRYRYTGKERDDESGLYYHGARYYAPWLARWTSCDPAGLAEGPNAYLYVRGQPLGSIDPSGGSGKSFLDHFKPGGRVFETADKVFNPNKESQPALHAVMNNLDKRGKDLVEGVQAELKQTAGDFADIAYYSINNKEQGAKQKIQAAVQRRAEAPVKKLEGAVVGFGQMVKRVGEAGGDIAYYTVNNDRPEASAKIANAVTDVVMDVPQIILTVEGGAGMARGAAGAFGKSAVAPVRPPAAAQPVTSARPTPAAKPPAAAAKRMNVADNAGRNTTPLSPKQVQDATSYAKSLGMPGDQISHLPGSSTGYISGWDHLVIGPDVLPAAPGAALNPVNPANSLISPRGAIAHEVVGHRAAARAQMTHSVAAAEEAQASFRAALRAPGLTSQERWMLTRDAAARLRNTTGKVFVWTR